jgi:transcriptional regulator with XRE-family HTH domain
MGRRPLESLGALVRKKRGTTTLRDSAKTIGISAATLLRVEAGRIPDVETFGRLCAWLGNDPAEFLGTSKASAGPGPLQISVHLRADSAPKQETIQALAQMLLWAARIQPPADEHA